MSANCPRAGSNESSRDGTSSASFRSPGKFPCGSFPDCGGDATGSTATSAKASSRSASSRSESPRKECCTSAATSAQFSSEETFAISRRDRFATRSDS